MSTERQAVFQDLGDNVDRLCTLDLRPPGPTSGYIGRFYQAVRTLTDAPLTLTAAQCLHQITPQSIIAIATGFCHPERLPYGETDGPPGAASLARAVRRGLACMPLILGEAAIEAPVQACVESLGLHLHRELAAARQDPCGVAFQAFPTEAAAAQAAAQQLVAQVRPAALVVTEKVGPNRLGVAHSAMGFAIPDGARALLVDPLDVASAAGPPPMRW